MKRHLFFLLGICLLFIANQTQAQHHKHGKRPMEGAGDMHKEIRKYAKENILPTLREQRIKFDTDLSTQEKAEIAQIREEFKLERQNMRKKHQELRKAKKEGITDIEGLKNEMKALREKHQSKVQKLEAIAKKHEARMTQLNEELKPKIEKWQADIEKIAAPYIKAEHLEHFKKGIGKRWHKKGIAFLLMPTEDEKETKKSNTKDVNDVQLYPNPAQNQQQLKVNVKEAGLVKIVLLDRQGKPIQTVFEGNKPAGEHIFEVDTQNLATGNYTYQIVTPTGKLNKKLVIKK